MVTWQPANLPTVFLAYLLSSSRRMQEYYCAVGHDRSLIRPSQPNVDKHLTSFDGKCNLQLIQRQ
jgi:hypothetical protein